MRSRACGIFADGVAAGEKAVVGVEGGVEQILPVELLEERGFKQVGGGLRIAGVLGMEALEAADGLGKVEVVEVMEGFAHLGIVVHGIGVDVVVLAAAQARLAQDRASDAHAQLYMYSTEPHAQSQSPCRREPGPTHA